MLAKRTKFGDFSPGSGRRQCIAIARSTGQRCRRDAVQGSQRCRSHGGVNGIRFRLAALGARRAPYASSLLIITVGIYVAYQGWAGLIIHGS
jgi:hypothetical protein